MTQRLPLAPTVVIVTLLGCLGAWQMYRLQWKEGILKEIAAVQNAPAIDLNNEPLRDLTVPDYQRVTVRGRFDHSHEFLIASRVHDGQVGYNVVTPFSTAMGQTYLVNRGWIPIDNEKPATRSAGQIDSETQIQGIARHPAAPTRWQPANDVARNRWYGYDLGLMYIAAEVKTKPLSFYIEADATPNPGGLPIGGVTKLDIPNNHLQYALTWYGLGALIALIFAVNRLQRAS